MDILNALIMGLVQGLAEFLPISSSGHLEIFREILGLDLSGEESLEFDVVLHIATVLSTIVVLWHEFVPLVTSFFCFKRDNNFHTVVKILISCIPVGIVGLCFKDVIESFFGTDLTMVGICLLVTAALLSFSYFFRTRPLDDAPKGKQPYKPRDITYLDAFIIGCAQAIAVLPGLSRSGTTIATGILIGDKRAQVARFSFLMVIIPILGQALLDIKDYITEPAGTVMQSIGWQPLLAGFLTAFVVGCIACRWMIEIVKKGKLIWFAIYCLAAGILCIIY